jgi:hypothetical protein
MASMFNSVLEEDDDILTNNNRPISTPINSKLWNAPSSNWNTHSSPVTMGTSNRSKLSSIEDEIIPSPKQHYNTSSSSINPPPPPRNAMSLEELEAKMMTKAPPTNIGYPPHLPPTNNSPQYPRPHMMTPPTVNYLVPPPTVGMPQQQNVTSNGPQYAFPQYRPKWKESKKYMSCEEIDAIIRIQDSQLQNNTNPFAEDYYCIKYVYKNQLDVFINHRPLFETSPRNVPLKRPGGDIFEGVLGRIPTHSVRAPRELLKLRGNNPDSPTGTTNTEANNTSSTASSSSSSDNSSSKAVYSLLLSIENAFSSLIDIEDIDAILKRPESVQHFNIAFLRQKREEITNELFKLLHIYVPPPPSNGQIIERPSHLKENQFLYSEDEVFINMSFISKGKRLIMRSLPLLFPYQLFAVLYAYLRNCYLIVTSPRIEIDIELTTKLFSCITDVIGIAPVPYTILLLQWILQSHSDTQLLSIVQSKVGMSIIQSILKRGHDLNLSPFGRDDLLSAEISNLATLPPLVQAGLQWKDSVNLFIKRMLGKFTLLFNAQVAATSKIWEFFAVLIVNINQESKRKILNELR